MRTAEAESLSSKCEAIPLNALCNVSVIRSFNGQFGKERWITRNLAMRVSHTWYGDILTYGPLNVTDHTKNSHRLRSMLDRQTGPLRTAGSTRRVGRSCGPNLCRSRANRNQPCQARTEPGIGRGSQGRYAGRAEAGPACPLGSRRTLDRR